MGNSVGLDERVEVEYETNAGDSILADICASTEDDRPSIYTRIQ